MLSSGERERRHLDLVLTLEWEEHLEWKRRSKKIGSFTDWILNEFHEEQKAVFNWMLWQRESCYIRAGSLNIEVSDQDSIIFTRLVENGDIISIIIFIIVRVSKFFRTSGKLSSELLRTYGRAFDAFISIFVIITRRTDDVVSTRDERLLSDRILAEVTLEAVVMPLPSFEFHLLCPCFHIRSSNGHDRWIQFSFQKQIYLY